MLEGDKRKRLGQANNQEKLLADGGRVGQNHDKNKTKKDPLKVIWYCYAKPGHFVSRCPKQIQKLQESNYAEADIIMSMCSYMKLYF